MAKKIKPSPVKKIVLISVIVLALGLAGYFGWQWWSASKKLDRLSDQLGKTDLNKEEVEQACRQEMASWQDRLTVAENSRMATEKAKDEALGLAAKYRDGALSGTFFGSSIKYGDKVLGWKVESVGPFSGDSPSFDINGEKPANLAVVFSGEALISGWTSCASAENIGDKSECGTPCLTSLDFDSELKMPRLKGDQREMTICFDQESVAKSGWLLGPKPEQKTVKIKDLTLNYSLAGEIVNTAKLADSPNATSTSR